ncbi:MAG: toprim domain-containing protein, partial [Anaerolineae bacterium]|nr:toprim domain-containing protein [Anaerolineae bacterium]
QETVVIVEGYVDAITAQQAGFQQVVAQMGTALTETQLKLIAPRWAKKIILALDSDAAGQNATMRSLEVARQTLEADWAGRLSVDVRILQIPGAKDPDDLIRESPERWGELIANATPVSDYVIEVETAHLPPNPTLLEREAVARRLLPILRASQNDLYLQDNLQKLAQRLRINERTLLEWSHEQRQEEARKPRPPVLTPVIRNDDVPPEAPPINYDSLTPPDDVAYEPDFSDLVLTPPTAKKASPKIAQREIPLEVHCVRLLLRQPDWFYLINRKFRELARNAPRDTALLEQTGLGELDVEDFQHHDFRALIQMFKQALSQDELEIEVFLRENLESPLFDLATRLVIEESQYAQQRLQGRMEGDRVNQWKNFERRIAVLDGSTEFIDKMLRLRQQRLQRDCQELEFLQREILASGDDVSVYLQHFALITRALNLIQRELQRLSKHFI